MLLIRVAGALGDFFGGELVGVYVHGSLAQGSFRRDQSDLDLLVVVARELAPGRRAALAKELLALAQSSAAGDLEVSVITEASARRFEHPLPYEVQYSAAWQEVISNDRVDYAGPGADPDLALHVLGTQQRGVRLVGPEPAALFGPVPWHAVVNALEGGFARAGDRAAEDPVSAVFNACRTLHVLSRRDLTTVSKEEAGRWALNAAAEFHTPIAAALDVRYGDRAALPAAAGIRALREYVAERSAPAFARARPDDGEDDPEDDAEE